MSQPDEWCLCEGKEDQQKRFGDLPRESLLTSWRAQQETESQAREASVCILYSGGIDSHVIAALCDKFVPSNETIDLINVSVGTNPLQAPDRLTAINGFLELSEWSPTRKWRLIQVNIDELQTLKNIR
ncbi:hypothetical protein RFI_34922, partial [Reticulomyxa filosa]